MNKKKLSKVTKVATASFLIAGTTAFTAFAAMPEGTVVIGEKAFALDYANLDAHVDEITKAVVASQGKVYVKGFDGKWINNATEKSVEDLSVIPAVEYKNAKGEITKYDAKDGKVTEVTPSKENLKVESVSAINLNQVKVQFSKKVQQVSAENVANYKLANDTLTYNDDHAKLLDDEQTVIITLKDVKNQNTTKSFEVKDSVIQQKDSGYSVPGYKTDVTFKDLVAPTVEKVTVDGAKTLKITFSEGVNKLNAEATDNYKLDGQSISSFGANIIAMNKDKDTNTPYGNVTNEVKIEFDSPIASGNHTLTIGASTSKDILDASNFALQKVEKSFTVEKVTGEPQIVSATGKVNGEVTLKFNVKMDKDKITNNAFQYEGRSASRAELDSDDSDDKTIKVYFDNTSFDEGANVLKILEGKLEDVHGNKVAPTDDKRISFTVSKDNTAPVLKDAYAVSERKIRLVFSESIDDKYLDEMRSNKNIKLKNSDGDTEYGNSSNQWESVKIVENHSNELEVTMPEGENADRQTYTRLGKATYTIVVKDICDKSGNEIAESKKTLTTIDNTDPTLKPGNNLLINTDKQTAKVLFNEPMDASSVGNVNNYLYNSGDGYKKLPSGSSITVANNGKSATINFPKDTITGSWLGGATVRVMNIKDAAGNTIDGNTADTANAQDATAATTDAPDFIDNLTVYGNDNEVWATVDVNDTLDTLNKDDFMLSANADAHGYLTISPSGYYVPKSVTRNGKTLTITWDQAKAIDAFKAAGENIRIPDGTRFTRTTNEEGIKLYATDDYDATDKIAPKLADSKDYPVIIGSDKKTITVKFNEVLKNNASLYEDDFSISIKGKSVDSDDIKATVSNNTITLEITKPGVTIENSSDVTVKFKSNVDIRDTSDNLFVPSTDEKTGRITIKTATEQASEDAVAKEAAAEAAVKAYENAKDTTLPEIELAERLETVATAKVNDVADAGKKVAFTGRITTRKADLTRKKTALQATETEAERIKVAEAAVKGYEDAKITTENEVILAKAFGQIATSKVNDVTTVATKAAFKARVDAKDAIIKIDEIAKGQSAAGVTIAEIKAVVGDIAKAEKVGQYQAAISAAENFALNSADKIKAMVTDVNTPVGVDFKATEETHKGAAGKAEVTAVAGIYSVTIGTADVTIDGKTFTYNASTENGKWKDATELVALINADTDLKVKYTAEVDSANVKLTQKAGKETPTAPAVSGTGASVAVTKAGVAHKAEVVEVKEVGTTTVTAGAAKDATIKINVTDGTLNKTVNVAVAKDDTKEVVAGKIRVALAADAAVKAAYDVTGADANIILTQKAAGSDVVLAVTVQP